MDGGGAYGAGMAGGSFDPIAYIKKPSVILRIISWLFAVVVFSCISAAGTHHGHCLFNDDSNACSYGIGIGVLAFMISIVFLIVDALFDNLSSVQHRKYAVIADMAISGLWALLWFIGFCYLADKWRRTSGTYISKYLNISDSTRYTNNVQAAIAFSFFSISTWTGLTVLAVRKYRQGVDASFAPTGGYESNVGEVSPYSSYPGGDVASEPYQQPPFNNSNQPPTQGDQTSEYQPPTY